MDIADRRYLEQHLGASGPECILWRSNKHRSTSAGVQPDRCAGILKPSTHSSDPPLHNHSCETPGPDVERKPSPTVKRRVSRPATRLFYIPRCSTLTKQTSLTDTFVGLIPLPIPNCDFAPNLARRRRPTGADHEVQGRAPAPRTRAGRARRRAAGVGPEHPGRRARVGRV